MNKLQAIDTEFTVWCYACSDWRRSTRKLPGGKPTFARRIQKLGWTWLPSHKHWLCPACSPPSPPG